METLINIYLGEKLKVMRDKKNIKQTEMAVIFGMKQQNYSQIELGMTHFSNKILAKINEVYNVTPIEFLTNPIPKSNTLVKTNSNQMDDFSVKVLLANLKKQVAEQKLRIINLEIELIQHKKDIVISDNVKPIYVLI